MPAFCLVRALKSGQVLGLQAGDPLVFANLDCCMFLCGCLAGQLPMQIASLISLVPSAASLWLLRAEMTHHGDHSLHSPPSAILPSSLQPQEASSPSQISVLDSVSPSEASSTLSGSILLLNPCTVPGMYVCGLLVDLPGGQFRLSSNRMSNPPVGCVSRCTVRATSYC